MALLIRFPLLPGGSNDIAEDFDGSFHTAEEGRNILFDWNQPGNRMSPLGNYDFPAGLLDFIEEMKAFCLEFAGRDCLFHSMVILPWSFVPQRHRGVQLRRAAGRQKAGAPRAAVRVRRSATEFAAPC